VKFKKVKPDTYYKFSEYIKLKMFDHCINDFRQYDDCNIFRERTTYDMLSRVIWRKYRGHRDCIRDVDFMNNEIKRYRREKHIRMSRKSYEFICKLYNRFGVMYAISRMNSGPIRIRAFRR
jgi:hypothetical protein